MLLIGQLAAYAGTTARAVRFYHQKGLLLEPERDASGYRRYDVAAVVELNRIRTLAEAGVPLSRVRELLAADPAEFAAAVAQIDERLRGEIRERQQHRKRIAQLAAGESLALPPEAVAYLDRMRELGFPERMVEGERDAWILVAAQLPESMPTYMASKRTQFEDPTLVELMRDIGTAILEWNPGDPRLPVLADRLVASIEAVDEADWAAYAEDPMSDELAALLDSVFLDSSPMAGHLIELLEERGWGGWTKLEPIGSAPRTAAVARRIDPISPPGAAEHRHVHDPVGSPWPPITDHGTPS